MPKCNARHEFQKSGTSTLRGKWVETVKNSEWELQAKSTCKNELARQSRLEWGKGRKKGGATKDANGFVVYAQEKVGQLTRHPKRKKNKK